MKFYEDLPPQTSPNSEIYRKLFALLVFFHFIGFTLSMAKLKFLMLSHEALIEDDGYVIKQVADLYYFANVTKMNRTSVGGRLLRALVIFLLDSLLGKNLTIIHFETRLDYLRCRYIKRKTHTEPSTYIDFQNEVYGKLSAALNGLIRGSIVKLDASNSINQVHQEVVKLIPKIEEN